MIKRRKFCKPLKRIKSEPREWRVKRNGRYFTFGFGSQYTDHADFAGRCTEIEARKYLDRGPEYEIEFIS